MCQEIFPVSVGTGVIFSPTISFTSIIVKYPLVFLNWWKWSNKCKYTFLFLGAGVELAWGKLENAAIKILWGEKKSKIMFLCLMIYESILFHCKLGGNFHWNPRNKLETGWKGVKVTLWALWSLFRVINLQSGRRQWRMAWKHIPQ